MRELSLFTGAGGGLLGTKLLGWEHIGYVEWNEYCQQVIAARIRDGYLPAAPIFTDVREFVQSGAAEQYRGFADVVSAGFPCQPFSVAGKQAGADDERNMWPATADVIRIVQPQSVLLENVPGLISAGYLGTVIGDLAEMGYVGRWGVIGARDCDAPHKRDRLWIVAHSMRNGCESNNGRESVSNRDRLGPSSQCGRNKQQQGIAGAGDVAYTKSKLCDGGSNNAGIRMEPRQVPKSGNGGRQKDVADADRAQRAGVRESFGVRQEHADACSAGRWWAADPADDPESGVGRMAPRMADGVDRLKAIGNGQSSAVVRRAWECLA